MNNLFNAKQIGPLSHPYNSYKYNNNWLTLPKITALRGEPIFDIRAPGRIYDSFQFAAVPVHGTPAARRPHESRRGKERLDRTVDVDIALLVSGHRDGPLHDAVVNLGSYSEMSCDIPWQHYFKSQPNLNFTSIMGISRQH